MTSVGKGSRPPKPTGNSPPPLWEIKNYMKLYQQPKEIILRSLGMSLETTDEELNKEIKRLKSQINIIEVNRNNPL